MAVLPRYVGDQFPSFILLDLPAGECMSLYFPPPSFGESHFAHPLHVEGPLSVSSLCHQPEPVSSLRDD